MENKDFRAGDKVTIYHPEFGKIETKVNRIIDDRYPIKTEYNEDFTFKGFYQELDRIPSLYHGWGLDIPEIKEKKPERYPWVNIYTTKNGGCVSGGEWETKKKALCEIKAKGWERVATIELKPKAKID